MTLRTPPVKESLLALREALGFYNGTPLNEVFADLYERLGGEPPPPPPPPPPPGGLTDEGFDSTSNPVAPTTITTTAASVTGSETLTHSTDWSAGPGGVSLKVDGTARHFLTFGDDYASEDEHNGSVYGTVLRWPSANAWLIAVRDGADGSTVGQIGLDSAGRIIVRTGDTGAVDDTSVATTIGDTLLFEKVWAPGGLTVAVYDGISEVLIDTITCPVSASTFSNDQIGLLEAIAGTAAAIGNLWNEYFTAGTNGTAVTTANRGTVCAAVSGGGSLTYSSTYFTMGLHVNGTARHTMRYDAASHGDDFESLAVRFVAGPSVQNAAIWELTAGNGTTIAAQIHITFDDEVRIRDGTTGTTGAGSADLSTTILTAGMWELVPKLSGAGNLELDIYNSVPTLVETLSCTLSATNFSNARVGLAADITSGTGPDIHFGPIKADSVAPPRGTVATGPLIHFDRFKTHPTTMPERLDLNEEPPDPGFDAKFVPLVGAYQGVVAAPTGSSGHTTLVGYNEWMGLDAAMKRPQIIGWYHKDSWNGVLTTEQKNLLIRPGEQPAIAHLRWKVRTTMTWAQIAAGDANADIDRVCNGLKQWPHAIMLTPYHEPDNDTLTGGNSAANFKLMWRHVYARCQTQLGPVAAARVAWVLNWAGWSALAGANASVYEVMYPGDDVVDWLGFNPYPHQFTRNTLSELVNENISGTTGWPGQYDYWLARCPTKPQMLCEWGIDHDDGGTGMTDTQAATVIDTIALDLADYPQLKAWEYWNAITALGVYQPQTANAAMRTSMKNWVNNPRFVQDMTLLP